jgi:hypothetical protein
VLMIERASKQHSDTGVAQQLKNRAIGKRLSDRALSPVWRADRTIGWHIRLCRPGV